MLQLFWYDQICRWIRRHWNAEPSALRHRFLMASHFCLSSMIGKMFFECCSLRSFFIMRSFKKSISRDGDDVETRRAFFLRQKLVRNFFFLCCQKTLLNPFCLLLQAKQRKNSGKLLGEKCKGRKRRMKTEIETRPTHINQNFSSKSYF
jgi:hypothetical protein